MPLLRFPRPAALRGGYLEDEIRSALGFQKVDVTAYPSEITVDVSEAAAAREGEIAAVVAAHTGQPTPAEVTARAARQADIDGLRAYQAAPSPTAAQTAAAVKALTRLVRDVIAELRD